MATLFGRFSRSSQQTLEKAHELAVQMSRPVQTDIVLLSIANLTGTPAAEILKSTGIDAKTLMEAILTATVPEASQEGRITAEMQQMLEESIKLAGKYRFMLVEVEHILAVIVSSERYSGYRLLTELGINVTQISARLLEWMQSISMLAQNASREAHGESDQEAKSDLDRYITDLTDLADEGKLDPVVGREAEIEQMIQILLRRRKNNPLLIGEPGVGKTALVDGLAQRIVKGAIPMALANKRLVTLDLSQVVAGTMYRGQFEERLKGIIKEIQEDGDTIVFIDEIHTLVGSGSSEGSFDGANILKPALARGDLSLIGATTHEEYRKHIMKDKALDRRFQSVTVDEPSTKESLKVLKSLKPELEKHHHVLITEESMVAAVDLSNRYIHDRFLPDKAIDVLDQASTLHAEAYKVDEIAESLEQKIDDIAIKRQQVTMGAESDQDYDHALILGREEEQLVKQLRKHRSDIQKRRVDRPVTDFHVATVISARSGVPMASLLRSLEPLDLARLSTALHEHVLGQAEATDRITSTLLRSQLGLTPEGKPMGAFLLVGPTGVGKTETARILAREVFGDPKALIKLDMSEYGEKHTVSNLIGAPAGYVGYDAGGTLTEAVRRRPYAVILMDEVEKAHPDVFNLLLQILEDGELTDNTGVKVSFAHTLVIMTSNIGMQRFKQLARIGFRASTNEEAAAEKEMQAFITKELADFFRPELLGRLSGVLFYKPLNQEVVKRLTLIRLQEMKRTLKKRGISISNAPSFVQWLVGKYDPDAGARSIERLFLSEVEPAIVSMLVSNPGLTELRLNVQDNQVVALTTTATA